MSASTVAGGAVAGSVGVAVGSPVQGIGNSAYFGDPYSFKQYGADVLMGGVLGGVAGGLSGYINNVKAAQTGNDLQNII